jgi:hypothetical protein
VGSTEPSPLSQATVPQFDADPKGLPENPFSSDVCRSPLELAKSGSVPGLNADVLSQLSATVENPSGGALILVTAPRSGYGKTHLLGRLVAEAGQQAIMVPLTFRTGDSLNLATVCRRGLEALSHGDGERPRWTRLREIHAGVVVALMHTLIEEGLLACANQDQALQVLSGSAVEIFDEEGTAQLIGDWLRKYRHQLFQPLAALAARYVPVRQELLGAWIEAMLDHAADGGTAGLVVMNELTASDAEANLPIWLRLIGLWRQPVLLVDHLDGFHRNPEAGVTIASLLMDIADSHGVHVLLSLNQDVWQATFGQHLPSALEDRLTSFQVLLRGLSAEEAGALVQLRLEASGIADAEAREFGEFLAMDRFFLGRPLRSVSARFFLRHAARQWEIFRHSVPPPPEDFAPAPAAASRSFRQESEPGSIPLMTETVDHPEVSAGMPAIFDKDTSSYVKDMAAGLAKPASALPKEEDAAPPEVAAPQPSGPWASLPPPDSLETGGTQPSADAFVKLREMLGRLRQPSNVAMSMEPSTELSTGTGTETATAVMERPAAVMEAEQEQEQEKQPRSDALLGRFEALRLQMSAEADSQPLDFTKLAELIRLAGRRFPLVRFSEHELPGLTGRYAMCWSLQGAEILFGMANFTDRAYWRTLSSFAAGRLADLATENDRQEGAATKLKLVTFKTDREQAGYQSLLDGHVIPEGLRGNLDTVHLDSGSVASLYSMQRIIKEAETGALQVEPAQVMSALARELDFFWKRVTRVG